MYLLIGRLQLRLEMLLEDFDRADVGAEKSHRPKRRIERVDGNARIVLQDNCAVGEQKIANGIETIFKHEIRRTLQKAVPGSLRCAEFHEPWLRADSFVSQIGSEVIERLW